MTGRDAEREEIELAVLLASPIYDTTTAIDAVEHIVRKRTAAALEAAAKEINEQRWRNRNGVGEARDAEHVVRTRAAALRASNGAGTTT